MRINENTAVSTPQALLVPYEHRHVEKYHGWMQDPAIQEATASEPLSLEEEYANQQSWRTSPDKLTFIVCKPVLPSQGSETRHVQAGVEDAPERMVGDVNFFIYPADEDDGEEGAESRQQLYEGEIDIMIADPADRSQGFGRGAVAALLYYVACHREEIMAEFGAGQEPQVKRGRLGRVMARIKQGNDGSIKLFRSLGFEQVGEVNYFGEVKMVMPEERFEGLKETMPLGYVECEYRREDQ